MGIPFDPGHAKALLVEAGYSGAESFPQVTLLVSIRGKGAPGAYYQMAKDIIAMWETHLGIHLNLEVVKMDTFRSWMSTGPPELFWMGWVADYHDPDNCPKRLFH